MKKAAIIIMALSLLLTASACSKNSDEAESNTSANEFVTEANVNESFASSDKVTEEAKSKLEKGKSENTTAENETGNKEITTDKKVTDTAEKENNNDKSAKENKEEKRSSQDKEITNNTPNEQENLGIDLPEIEIDA